MPLNTSSSNCHGGGGTKNYRDSTKQTEPIKVGSYDLNFGQSLPDVGVVIENTGYKRVTLRVVQWHFYLNLCRSCNHCCSGKAVIVTYSECLSVALDIQHAMRMRHIVIRVLSGSTLFLHVIL